MSNRRLDPDDGELTSESAFDETAPSTPGDAAPRRDFLSGGVGALASFVAVNALVGCGGSDDAPSASGPSGCVPSPTGGSTPATTPSGGGVPNPLPAQLSRFTGDPGPQTAFTRMDWSNATDWGAIAEPTMTLERNLPNVVTELLLSTDRLYLGFGISQLTHALQAATRAYRANASDELVFAALVHDMGKAITEEGHAEVSAGIVRTYVSEYAYRIIRHHTEFEWAHSGAARGLPTDERNRYANELWYGDAVRFSDEWDRPAYDPSFVAKPFGDFEPLIRQFVGIEPNVFDLISTLTSSDCL